MFFVNLKAFSNYSTNLTQIITLTCSNPCNLETYLLQVLSKFQLVLNGGNVPGKPFKLIKCAGNFLAINIVMFKDLFCNDQGLICYVWNWLDIHPFWYFEILAVKSSNLGITRKNSCLCVTVVATQTLGSSLTKICT